MSTVTPHINTCDDLPPVVGVVEAPPVSVNDLPTGWDGDTPVPRFVLVGKAKGAIQDEWPDLIPTNTEVSQHLRGKGNKVGIEPASIGCTAIDIDADDEATVAAVEELCVRELGPPDLRVASGTHPHVHLIYRALLDDGNKRNFHVPKLADGAKLGEIICRRSYVIIYDAAAWRGFIQRVLDGEVPDQPDQAFDFLPAPKKHPNGHSPAGLVPGNRNNEGYRLFQLRAADPEACEEVKRQLSAAGLPDKEIESVYASALNSEVAKKKMKEDAEDGITVVHTPAYYAELLLTNANIGKRLAFDKVTGLWHRWDGIRWRPDRTFATLREVSHMCVSTARLGKYKKADAYWGRFARDVLDQLMWHLTLEPNSMDTHRHLLGTPVGTVDLRTGELVTPQPEWLITKSTTVAPDFESQPVRFLRFLREIAPHANDEEWVTYIQRYLGYALTGEINDHRCQFWHGGGTNGKSALWELVSKILGPDYFAKAETKMLEVRRGEAHSTELTVTRGKRLVVVSEVQDKHLNVGRFKDLTGDSEISGRGMRENSTSWPRYCKLLLVGNQRPKLAAVDSAIRRRIRQVPFTQDFSERRDAKLETDLLAEAPAVLAWLIEGAKMFYAADKSIGDDPTSVQLATDSYFISQDVLRQWCEDCIEIAPTGNVTNGQLKASFEEWAKDAGVEARYKQQEAIELVSVTTSGEHTQYRLHGKRVRGFKGLRANNVEEIKLPSQLSP